MSDHSDDELGEDLGELDDEHVPELEDLRDDLEVDQLVQFMDPAMIPAEHSKRYRNCKQDIIRMYSVSNTSL